MTFNPCLPRLSSKAGLSQGGSKALLPVKSSPQAIIMSVGDAVGAPAKEAKEAPDARRTSRVSPGGRPRGTPRRRSRPPAWLQGTTAACCCCSKSADTGLNCRKSADTGLNCRDVAATVAKERRGGNQSWFLSTPSPGRRGLVTTATEARYKCAVAVLPPLTSGVDSVLVSSSFVE